MVIVIYFIVPTTLDVRVVLGCACLYIRNSYTCEKCVIPIIARTEKLQCVSPSTGLYVFSQCYWSILEDRSNLYFAVNIRLQNVNGGHSGTLAFYFCPFWGTCRQVTRACRQDYFFVTDI